MYVKMYVWPAMPHFTYDHAMPPFTIVSCCVRRVLVYVVDAAGVDGRHPLDDLASLQQELEVTSLATTYRSC